MPPKGPKPAPAGIVFPTDDKGKKGSTFGNKGAIAAANGAFSKEEGEKVANERSWRGKYEKHILRQVQLSCTSPEASLKIAKAGLQYCHDNFEFIRDGTTYSVGDAMKKFTGSYETGFIQGSKPKPKGPLTLKVPYNGKDLEGDELKAQLQKWADYGTIEQSCADAIKMVVDNPEWNELEDKYFVLLGAGSAMGPILVLLALGANIIALDLDRPGIWKRLLGLVENSHGTMTFPLKKPQAECSGEEIYENAGCNLFTETPEIANWVSSLYPKESFIMGAYAYLDGELHVRVSLAMDLVISKVQKARGPGKAGCAYLCTPTDAHCIPRDAYLAAKANYTSFSPINLFHKLSPFFIFGGKSYLVNNALKPVKADNGDEFYIVDGLVGRQGPNYALAKRMQHWRAMVARSEGQTVSSNIAPSTSTVSVTSNKLFALAYGGMHWFKPMEVSAPETSNAVMGALLIHDVRNKESVANPKTPVRNQIELFTPNSFHGGVWRCGYKIHSIGEPAAVLYLLSKASPYFLLAFIVALVSYLVQTGVIQM